MRLKKFIKKYFHRGNVFITGLRGSGKDLIMGNVIVRRNKSYISNLDYTNGKNYTKLDFKKLDVGENTYKDFLNGNLKYYDFSDHYVKGSDIYISDAGVYFPSQYCNELNRDLKHFPAYMALSRQLSRNNVHVNVQNLNRVWDKIREQSDIYIRCKRTFYIPFSRLFVLGRLFNLKDFCITSFTVYEKYESCLNRLSPCRIKIPWFNKEAKMAAKIAREQYYNQNGLIENRFLFFFNKSSYDTYYFEKLLKEVHNNEKQN